MTIPILNSSDSTSQHFLETETAIPETVPDETPVFPTSRKKYSIEKIVQVLLRKSLPQVRTVEDDWKIEVSNANGTVKSIREWGKAAFKDNRKQIRAFESIISAFLLTFYDEKPDEMEPENTAGSLPKGHRAKFRVTKRALMRLKGSEKEMQLVCLLHGPGGSGKSAVINLVQAYARSYCENIGHPYTSRTIVISAMSGVAATLLHGETTHSLLGLNRSSITKEEQEMWADT